MSRVRVIGVGNSLRGDDGAGPAVIDALAGEVPDDVELVAAGADILEHFDGCDVAVIVDAAMSGASPGSVHRLDCLRQPLRLAFRPASSHALGLADAIELARVLDRLPREVIVYAIEADQCEPGAGLSEPVRAAVQAVAAAVSRELRQRS